jgi:CHAT domain
MPRYPVQWSDSVPLFVVRAAQMTLNRIVAQALERDASWVVLRRSHLDYAFRAEELVDLADQRGRRARLPAVLALGLWKHYASASVPLGTRPAELDYDETAALPSVGRAVAYDASGEPVSVGETVPAVPEEAVTGEEEATGSPAPGMEPWLPEPAPRSAEPPPDLGALRGAGQPPEPPPGPAAEPSPMVDAVLSAQVPAQVVVDKDNAVDVKVELAIEATPYARAVSATIREDEEIAAILTGFDWRKLFVEDRVLRLATPKAGRPSIGAFVVRGREAGPTNLTVLFQQGGSELGQLSFALDVVAEATGDPVQLEQDTTSAPREEEDDRVVALLIDEEEEGGRIRYRCIVTSDLLGLDNAQYFSDFVQARAGSVGSAALGYVRSIYRRITERVLVNRSDLELFERELKAIGADMGRQLLSPELTRVLWEARDDIDFVKVTSLEPYLPWELLRLKHPDTGKTDDRYLCEYGLIRGLSGRAAPRELNGNSWRYLVGEYPFGSLAAVGREADYVINSLPRRGLIPQRIEADATAVLDALADPDFDVFHIACHGSADLDDIERTELAIADRELPDHRVVPVSISATTVREEAKLLGRAPLVFLNACETAQQAPSLTDWGGWPKTFWDAGAGAYVGTSWSVRESPAAAFAEAFYEALLGNATLAQAARVARSRGKEFHDASWLAFVVYGQPNARLTRA